MRTPSVGETESSNVEVTGQQQDAAKPPPDVVDPSRPACQKTWRSMRRLFQYLGLDTERYVLSRANFKPIDCLSIKDGSWYWLF